MYQSIWELPTPVLNSLNEEDATKWLTTYNECDPKNKDEIAEAKKKAWRSVEDAPSSFSFKIIASTDTIDKAREVIDLESIKKHMDSFIEYGGNIQNDHHNYTVGTIWDWEPCKVKDDRGNEVDGILTYGNIYGGDYVYDKIRQSFVRGMNSLSVAGEALPGRYQCDEKGCYTRRKVQQLMEISLCVEPMNKYCTLVDYNKGAEFAKSTSAMNLVVKEYTIHRDQSACPLMSLKKSLQSIGYDDVHAKEDGVHIPMSREEFEATLPIMHKNGLVARYYKGEAIIHRRDDLLEKAFKRSIASGYCEPDGAITKRMPKHVFSEYYENGLIGEDGLGGYGFKKSNPQLLPFIHLISGMEQDANGIPISKRMDDDESFNGFDEYAFQSGLSPEADRTRYKGLIYASPYLDGDISEWVKHDPSQLQRYTDDNGLVHGYIFDIDPAEIDDVTQSKDYIPMLWKLPEGKKGLLQIKEDIPGVSKGFRELKVYDPSLMRNIRRFTHDTKIKKSLENYGMGIGLSPDERRILRENNQLRYDDLEKMLKDPKKWYLTEDGISTQGYHGFGKDDDEGRKDWLDKTYDRVKESKLRAWRAYYLKNGGTPPPNWKGE